MTREQVLERRLRRIRQVRFDYPANKEQQLDRILGKLKAQLRPYWQERESQVNHAYGQRILYRDM